MREDFVSGVAWVRVYELNTISEGMLIVDVRDPEESKYCKTRTYWDLGAALEWAISNADDYDVPVEFFTMKATKGWRDVQARSV